MITRHCYFSLTYMGLVMGCLVWRQHFYVVPQHQFEKLYIVKELGEIVLFNLILFNLRPRNWPQFFALNVSEDPWNEGFIIDSEDSEMHEAPLLADMNHVTLNEWCSKATSVNSSFSIHSDEACVVMNPAEFVKDNPEFMYHKTQIAYKA